MASNHHNHIACEVWRALAAAALLAFGIGFDVHGEQMTSASYKIDISNNPVWYDSNGNLVSQGGTGSRLSVLERWKLQSQPIVSITNLSADTSLVGMQLDLSKSASKIVSCTWLEAPAKSSWNWHDPCASAMFQFRDPIGPGDVVTMRLGTAARANSQGMCYLMNQMLFHPSLGDCLTTTTNFGMFTLFFRPTGQTSIPQFDSSGLPVPGGISAQTISFANARISGETVTSLSGDLSVVVPVPEPGTLALVAWALGMAGGWHGLRRRAA